MKLVIFDMDQTLIEVITVHDEATRQVFLSLYRIEARLTEIDYAGRSLRESFVELARVKGLPADEVRGRLDEMLSAYDVAFDRTIPADATPYVLPGVFPLLEALAHTDHLPMLYTGDSRPVVRAVFRTTGLGKYFRDVFCGTEVKARADMVRQALARAKEMTGREFSGKDIVIIGDSARDIECGKQFNARVIALLTGHHTVERLAALKPDYLFPDLTDTAKVLEAIGR